MISFQYNLTQRISLKPKFMLVLPSQFGRSDVPSCSMNVKQKELGAIYLAAVVGEQLLTHKQRYLL